MFSTTYEHFEIAQIMIKQVCAIATLRYGPRHPFGQICSIFSASDRVDLPGLLNCCVRRYLEAWQRLLGPEHPTVLLTQLRTIVGLVDHGTEDAGSAAKQALELRDLTKKKSLFSTALRLGIDLMSSYLLAKAGKLRLGLELYRSCLSETDGPSLSPQSRSINRTFIYKQLWHSYQVSRDIALVENFIEETVSNGVEEICRGYTGPTELLLRPGMFLHGQGRQEEAGQVRAQI